MDAAMTRISASVAASKTVKASAGVLIASLAERVRSLPVTAAAIAALADELDASNVQLQNDIAAGTTAAPEVPVPSPEVVV